MRANFLRSHISLCIFKEFLCKLKKFHRKCIKTPNLMASYDEYTTSPSLHLQINEYKVFWNALEVSVNLCHRKNGYVSRRLTQGKGSRIIRSPRAKKMTKTIKC